MRNVLRRLFVLVSAGVLTFFVLLQAQHTMIRPGSEDVDETHAGLNGVAAQTADVSPATDEEADLQPDTPDFQQQDRTSKISGSALDFREPPSLTARQEWTENATPSPLSPIFQMEDGDDQSGFEPKPKAEPAWQPINAIVADTSSDDEMGKRSDTTLATDSNLTPLTEPRTSILSPLAEPGTPTKDIRILPNIKSLRGIENSRSTGIRQTNFETDAHTSPDATDTLPATTNTSLNKRTDESARISASNPLPSWDSVQQSISSKLKEFDNYEAGDLLTVQDAELIFEQLEDLGWIVAERKETQKLFLPENDWVVIQLRTSEGRKFMREIGHNPAGYDRADRLRRMPRGEQQLMDLIRRPDGYKMIEYMVTTPGGDNLGRFLSKGQNGSDFNQPTGRMYTEKQFLERLKQCYDAELQRRGVID